MYDYDTLFLCHYNKTGVTAHGDPSFKYTERYEQKTIFYIQPEIYDTYDSKYVKCFI